MHVANSPSQMSDGELKMIYFSGSKEESVQIIINNEQYDDIDVKGKVIITIYKCFYREYY